MKSSLPLHIEPINELDLDAIAPLMVSSEREQFNFVRRLVNDWQSEINRFARPSEQLFVAKVASQVIGIGGLNVDPYQRNVRIGRIRHLYVLPEQRRRGVAGNLVQHILEFARGRFDQITLRTDTDVGSKFYESLGFEPTHDSESASHVFVLNQPS